MEVSGKSLDELTADLTTYVSMHRGLVDYQAQMMEFRRNLDALRKADCEDIDDLTKRAEKLRDQLMRAYEAHDADIMLADAHCDTQWAAKRLQCLRESTGFGVIHKSMKDIDLSMEMVEIRMNWCGALSQDLVNKIKIVNEYRAEDLILFSEGNEL